MQYVQCDHDVQRSLLLLLQCQIEEKDTRQHGIHRLKDIKKYLGRFYGVR